MDSDKPSKKFNFVPNIPKRKSHDDIYHDPIKSKKVKVEKSDDENVVSTLNSEGSEYVSLPISNVENVGDDEIGWIKFKNRIVELTFVNLEKQIYWLRDNIFVNDKNFFYYLKRQSNNKNIYLMVREAARLLKSEYSSKLIYYKKMYNPYIDRTINNSPFKLKEQIVRQTNDSYFKLYEEYRIKNNSVNRKFGIVRSKLLKMDPGMNYVLKNVGNKEQLFKYLYESNNKTITVNY